MDVDVQVRALLQNRKAQSACCAEPLNPAPEGAGHEFTCSGCGQPTQRVLGEPTEIIAEGNGVL